MHTIEHFLGGDSLLLRRHGYESASQAFNEMLEKAAEYDDLEALILLSQDVWVEDEDFLARVRKILGEAEDIAVIGARNTYGVPATQLLDGSLAVLPGSTVHEFRFDESITGPIECSIRDLSHQAREDGGRVIADDIRVVRRSRGLLRSERRSLVEGTAALRRKWGDDVVP